MQLMINMPLRVRYFVRQSNNKLMADYEHTLDNYYTYVKRTRDPVTRKAIHNVDIAMLEAKKLYIYMESAFPFIDLFYEKFFQLQLELLSKIGYTPTEGYAAYNRMREKHYTDISNKLRGSK